ncbi:MAG: hypothetical protein ABL907_19615 [Hyphomicrobium sp.]
MGWMNSIADALAVLAPHKEVIGALAALIGSFGWLYRVLSKRLSLAMRASFGPYLEHGEDTDVGHSETTVARIGVSNTSAKATSINEVRIASYTNPIAFFRKMPSLRVDLHDPDKAAKPIEPGAHLDFGDAVGDDYNHLWDGWTFAEVRYAGNKWTRRWMRQPKYVA